jgi:hypothetical protein
MSSEKKKMVNKTFSHHLHASKDASTSMLGEVMITECERTTGVGECHPFLRTNAHSGPIPWTGSLWRARPRRGNPQHFVHQHRGMEKLLWQRIPADLRDRRPTTKIVPPAKKSWETFSSEKKLGNKKKSFRVVFLPSLSPFLSP